MRRGGGDVRMWILSDVGIRWEEEGNVLTKILRAQCCYNVARFWEEMQDMRLQETEHDARNDIAGYSRNVGEELV